MGLIYFFYIDFLSFFTYEKVSYEELVKMRVFFFQNDTNDTNDTFFWKNFKKKKKKKKKNLKNKN